MVAPNNCDVDLTGPQLGYCILPKSEEIATGTKTKDPVLGHLQPVAVQGRAFLFVFGLMSPCFRDFAAQQQKNMFFIFTAGVECYMVENLFFYRYLDM